jgi:formate/nitrite transporter
MTDAEQASPLTLPPWRDPAWGDLAPAQTAERVVDWSIAKTALSPERLIVLGLLAGAFIAIGGALFTAVMAETSLGHGPSRLLGGFVFSGGLLMVSVCGAELSTGNCLMFTAWAGGRISAVDLGRNLACSYAANAAGALAFAALIAAGGLLHTAPGHVAVALAEAKMNLSFGEAFVRGVLCNALVCTAVWMALATRTTASKLVALALPISAFVTLGFEHSIANVYLLAAGLLAGAAGSLRLAIENLVAVTLGNVVGGAIVALGIWMAYLRGPDAGRIIDISARRATRGRHRLAPE